MRSCQADSARDGANSAGLQFAPELVGKRTLNERAVAGLKRLRDRRAFIQKDLADKSGTPESSFTRIWAGTQPVSLKMLDAVEQLTNVNALTLLVDDGELVEPVTRKEQQILRWIRTWPDPTVNHLVAFLSFFANDDPETHDEKVAFEQLRRLRPPAVKRRAYAYLTFLSEGGLTPDLLEAFGLQETTAAPPTRRRKRTSA